MLGREGGKNVLAPEVGGACSKALSQEGKGEFENEKEKSQCGPCGSH